MQPLPTYLHTTYLLTYPYTYLPTYLPTYVPTPPTQVRTTYARHFGLPTHLPNYPPTYTITHPPTHVHTTYTRHSGLPTYLPTHELSTCIPIHVPTYPPSYSLPDNFHGAATLRTNIFPVGQQNSPLLGAPIFYLPYSQEQATGPPLVHTLS
jgi:hypothetical protein